MAHHVASAHSAINHHRGRLRWSLLRHGHPAAFSVMRMPTAQTGGAPFSTARWVAAVAVPSSSVRMELGLGSWLGLDVVAKLRGLLCFCFFKTSAHMRTAPWNPGGYTYAVIAFRRCPPSIEEATKIKSPNLFQVESNKMSRDVKGLFLGVRSVSSRVIIISWLGCSSRMSSLSRGGVVLEVYVMGLPSG
jgi:hypothetical protein